MAAVNWPAAMPPTLEAKAAAMITQYRKEDQDRTGGPHVSPYGLQHSIQAFYPDPRYLKDDEELDEPMSSDFSDRFNPLHPLVADEFVQRHTGRGTLQHNMFQTFYRATIYTNISTFELLSGKSIEQRLEKLMNFPGRSSFCFTPFRKQGDTSATPKVMLRMTVHAFVNVTIMETPELHEYTPIQIDLPFKDFLVQLCTDENRAKWAWVSDLEDLVFGHTQRAIKHRLLMRAMQYRSICKTNFPELHDEVKEKVEDAIESKYKFMPNRYPKYAMMYESRRVNYLNIPEEDRKCYHCWNQFDAERVPLRLACDTHYMCEESFVAICEADGPDKAKCGLDQKPFFDDWRKEYLKYGVLNGKFDPPSPSRYEEWENIHRSMADLDKYDRSGQTSNGEGMSDEFMIRMDPEYLVMIWMDMIRIDNTWPDRDHHRPVLFPEFPHVMEAFCQAVYALRDKKVLPLRHASTYIQKVIEHVLVRLTVANRGTVLFRPNECARLYQRRKTKMLPPEDLIQLQLYRDGLREFIIRVVNRTLKFARLRSCPDVAHLNLKALNNQSDRAGHWELRNHKHGKYREYYNEKIYELAMGPRNSELPGWSKQDPLRPGHEEEVFYDAKEALEEEVVEAPGNVEEPQMAQMMAEDMGLVQDEQEEIVQDPLDPPNPQIMQAMLQMGQMDPQEWQQWLQTQDPQIAQTLQQVAQLTPEEFQEWLQTQQQQ